MVNICLLQFLKIHVSGRTIVLQRRRLNAASRRPTMAIVFTAVLLASAIIGVQGGHILNTQEEGTGPITASLNTETLKEGNNVVVDDAAIATQGQAGGPRTVKEFSRDEEFSMFALSWEGKKDVAAFVRAQKDDGSWSDWYDAEPIDATDHQPRSGTELVFVEPTKKIQVSTSGVDLLGDAPAPEVDPASIKAVFIDGKADEGKIALAADSTDATGMPRVISRSEWGADESIRCAEPDYDDETNAITIHHTAGSNNYTEAEAAGIVRGIYQYHAQTLGWCDVGYHSLVDKYGNIYEGHSGGLNKPVQGVHAGGFNSNTWAISFLGNYDEAPATQAMIDAAGNLAGWRAKVGDFDPKGSDVHYSEGTPYTRFAYGQEVTLPNIFAHRDVGDTACPGQNVYDRMDEIRNIASNKYHSINSTGGSQPSNHNASNNNGKSNDGAGKSQSNALQSLVNSSSQGGQTANLGSLAAFAVSAFLAKGGNSQLSSNGNSQVLGGIKLGDIPSILNGMTKLTGGNATLDKILKLASTLAPILGNSRGPAQQVRPISEKNSDVTVAPYDNGVIVSSPEAGTHALWGAIGDAWAEQGFDAGPLGLPLNEEYQEGGLTRVDFQGGYITHNAETQETQIHANEAENSAPVVHTEE